MAKAIAVSSAELRGIGVALAVDLAQAIGASVGDYVLITASSGVKAPGVVLGTTSLRNTCLISSELAEEMGLGRVSLVDVTKPQVKYAERIYVKVLGGGKVNVKNLRTQLYDVPLLNKTKVVLSINGERVEAVIIVDLGEEGKIYRVYSSTEVDVAALNSSSESERAQAPAENSELLNVEQLEHVDSAEDAALDTAS